VYLLIANPTSGGGRGRVVTEAVKNWLKRQGREYEELVSTSAESAVVALRGALTNRKFLAVIAVGGDGMMNLVFQQLAGSSIPLLPIAAGTGNDFTRTLGIERGPAALKLLDEVPSQIDLGRVNGRYFGAILSTGFDSLVNERANRMRIKHRIKYNLAMLRELPVFKPIEYQFEIDGRKLESEAMLIAIGNGKSYGGGMLVCPSASLSDDRLDLMVLAPVSKPEFLKVFPKVYRGAHIDHPQVSIYQGRSIRITASAVAYADGERIGELPIEAQSQPQALYTWVAK
jgi:diacylglycerol kinase (ATP)